ncbi:MAG: thiamine pyrophosphate-binding protein [Eubacterium sp.]|nr:thiamine pyrophosphate-binding protein [Eubacterium sp.]
MTVSEYIFNYLSEKGISKVFMVSGSSSMWLTDALCRNKSLHAVCCHHEQAAAMAADGYGRVCHLPGACLVTIGPGATNAITGVAQAFLDSSPMIVISGQANSRLVEYSKNTGIRQYGTQSLNLEPIVTPITKYFKVIMSPDEIIPCIEKAFYLSMNGRKGPVWIDIPVDIQNKTIHLENKEAVLQNLDFIQEKVYQTQTNYTAPNFDEIIRDIQNADKPLILAGGGVKSAGACVELCKTAEIMQIPIVTSRGGIDVIASNHPMYIGRPGAYGDRASHFALQQCDFLLIIGSRLSISTIGYYPKQLAQYAKKIIVDIDPLELDKTDVPINEKYNVDAKEFLIQLLRVYMNMENHKDEDKHVKWQQYLLRLKKDYPVVLPRYKSEYPLNEYWVTKRISDFASEHANVVVDTGSVCNIVSQSWQLKKGQNYLISGGLSCMGFWVTALGAYEERKQLLAIAGDGSTQMNIQELATLKYNQIPLKLFVYFNNGYMLIRHNQHNYMDDRFLGVGPDSGLYMPDLSKVADAYEIRNVKIDTVDDLEQLLPDVFAAEEPVVCQINVKEFAPIIPRISSKVMPDGTLKAADFDDLYPFLGEEEKNNLRYK